MQISQLFVFKVISSHQNSLISQLFAFKAISSYQNSLISQLFVFKAISSHQNSLKNNFIRNWFWKHKQYSFSDSAKLNQK